MTSAINYLSINENFPVAGEDNDTQVFRDNFDTIKTSLRVAKEEISDLQTNSANLSMDNDFNYNVIQNAVLQSVREKKLPIQDYVNEAGADWQNGSYQIFRVITNSTMTFENLPGDPNTPGTTAAANTVGKLTLELYSDGTSRTLTFLTPNGAVIKSNGFPGYASGAPALTLASSTNPTIVEIWRHSSNVIFMKYIGQFA